MTGEGIIPAVLTIEMEMTDIREAMIAIITIVRTGKATTEIDAIAREMITTIGLKGGPTGPFLGAVSNFFPEICIKLAKIGEICVIWPYFG